MISYVRRRICLLTVLVLLSSLLAAFPTASYAVGAYPSAPFAIPTSQQLSRKRDSLRLNPNAEALDRTR